MEKAHDTSTLLQIDSEHRYRTENLPFDIDVWYPALTPFTFRTSFVPLTRTEAEAILHYQQLRFIQKPGSLKERDVAALKVLEERLDIEIVRQFQGRGAFLRLCGRSPKDADPLDRDFVRHNYAAQLDKLVAAGAELTANTKMRAVANMPSWLRVRSGAEAMSLLLTSERVFADMHDWLKWGEPEQIVLREWEEELVIEYEFRAFIHDNEIRAISQYDHYCVYPNLVALKERIQELIFAEWARVHPFVGEAHYVIDFGYLVSKDTVVVIEISPFRDCTGTALFKWAQNREQLTNGPFEFRLRETEYPNLSDLIEVNWEDRWLKNVDPYHHWYKYAQPIEAPPPQQEPSSSIFSAWTRRLFGGGEAAASTSVPVATVDKNKHLLFFYGTLKRDFHWHAKFLFNAEYRGTAVSADLLPLVIGDCGVPYLLGDLPGQGKHVKGEVWCVNDETLLGLDEYEGINKGYYSRREIEVHLGISAEEPSTASVGVYFKTDSNQMLRAGPFLEEYTLAWHKDNYRAIRHIWIKQELYMQGTNRQELEHAS
eukprot:TRINITY_DN3064_c0_g1_i1.p1 TRINITY_DN3064_c0_g1~~TRINITY_DN3064_c0_g1_i1.p1  ORF type:complete len:541 (+),score=79.64 TRINITY_DN3064_c0_g1_i1:40-1662(+)